MGRRRTCQAPRGKGRLAQTGRRRGRKEDNRKGKVLLRVLELTKISAKRGGRDVDAGQMRSSDLLYVAVGDDGRKKENAEIEKVIRNTGLVNTEMAACRPPPARPRA